MDARGYKRRLRGLVEEARAAAVGGAAAVHHAERKVYVAQECAALAGRVACHFEGYPLVSPVS